MKHMLHSIPHSHLHALFSSFNLCNDAFNAVPHLESLLFLAVPQTPANITGFDLEL